MFVSGITENTKYAKCFCKGDSLEDTPEEFLDSVFGPTWYQKKELKN